MSVVLSIDPGALSGAIACFIDGELHDVIDMPCADKVIAPRLLCNDLVALTTWRRGEPLPRVIVEKVHAMPKQGVTSMFKFGRSLGVIEGVIAGLGWPLVWITPQVWKAQHGLLRKDKDAARLLAIETWPQHADKFRLKKHVGRADAALIGKDAAL